MTATSIERFWRKVDQRDADGCWIWTGAGSSSNRDRDYGRVSIGGKLYLAHRVAFVLANGEPPEGTELDHLCRVVRCVRPSHLEAVTHQLNIVRGESPSAKNAKQRRCPNGHPYSTNTTGKRYCQPCKRAAWRQWWNATHGTGVGSGGLNRAKDRCKNDHPYDAENTYWRSNGSRDCKTCRRARKRDAYRRKISA